MHALPIAWERHLTQGGKTLDPKVDLQLWAGVCGEREREGRERIVGQYCQRTGYNYLLQRSGQLPNFPQIDLIGSGRRQISRPRRRFLHEWKGGSQRVEAAIFRSSQLNK